MKRALLLALLPCAAMAGQFSVSAIAGYGLPFPGNSLGSNVDYRAGTTTANAAETDNEVVSGSFADGMRFGAEAGYDMNEYVTLGLGVRYEKSSEYEFTNDRVYSTYTTKGTRTRQISGIAFIPGVLFALPGEKYRPYARVNGHIGLPTEVLKYDFTSSSTTGSDANYEIEYKGGIAWGFGGGLGVEYKITPILSLLAEVMSESWTWGAKEGEYKKYNVEGKDVLSEMNVSERKMEYVDSYTDKAVRDTTVATKSLRTTQTSSAIALNIGLKFHF